MALRFLNPHKNSPILDQDAPSVETTTMSPSNPVQTTTTEHAMPSSAEAVKPVLLGTHLREIGQCLNINNALNDTAADTFAELQSSLQSVLGEVIAKGMDWSNVHVTLPSGEKRRIHLEVEASGDHGTVRRLKYYGVDAEDLPVPLTLPKDQSENPSDTFIASLENEGQITLREEARRGIYSQGAELYYVERNGALSEIELSYQGKSVKCQGLNATQGHCSCF